MSTSLPQEFELLWESGNGSPDVFAFLAEHPDSNESDVLAVLLHDQQRRWQTNQPLRVEEYLQQLPALASNSHAKVQLAKGEFQSRFTGETLPSIEEFTSRFSDVSDVLRPALEQLAYATVKPESTVREQYIGRYRLSRMLGKGAFGIVWLAFDTELHRQVAIKVPTAERFKRPKDAETYLAEARMVARLDHPNIVPVHDVGRTDDSSVYVVSKFIEGGTLADRIAKDRPTFDKSAKLIATCAMALAHAHEKRLVHRDIKPANILIEAATNTPYVADFGLAIREEDYAQHGGIAGTPAYMSPEQARGEGHRLDGRSDIFSLGTVLYELLSGHRPFRGSTPNELMHQVVSVDPASPLEADETIPTELERICLKALSKRASDRYATAALFAEDLLHWNQSPGPERKALQITPKGLRSFDAADADFFLDLLPGPRNRDGLPESIQFWKTRIEETDADQTFAVGLIYGPSGCGKSSLVKAGLLPRLSKDVVSVYVEATPDDTETRILRGLKKQLPALDDTLSLVDAFTWLRRREGRKVVVVLDQFEQWLHTRHAEQSSELIAAMRQCDGGTLQAVVMVRDDFAMAAARFMDALDIPIVQGHNFATVDLFDIDHAEKVLIKFGQAFGKLPAQSGKLSDQEQTFVRDVVGGLAQDDKVVSVRLALFAEMVKGKPWLPATLQAVGGTAGIGVNFLEETFSARTANPKHRLHEKSAREVLKALLPEVASDIKGHMRSHAELLAASGHATRPAEFNELLRILDGELRLITPTDPEGLQSDTGSDPNAKFYQLTHDYLVPSLRQWLTQKQQETRKGRAELRLAERSSLWNAKPENRHLPNLLEWGRIRTLTDRNTWSRPETDMMRRANRVHLTQLATVLTSVVLLSLGGLWFKSRLDETQMRNTAHERVTALLNAETRDVPRLVEGLQPYRRWTDFGFEQALSSTDVKQQLHARIALLPVDASQIESLKQSLLEASPANVLVLRDVLQAVSSIFVEDYWQLVSATDINANKRLAAAAALAKFAANDPRWTDVASSIARLLIDENPIRLATWIEAFRPVRASLIPELAVFFRDQSEQISETQRDLATSLLETFAADDVDRLAELILDAQPKQFAVLFDEFEVHSDQAKERMQAALSKKPTTETLARQQANAAVALVRLGQREEVFGALRVTDDPESLTQFIHRCRGEGATAADLLECVQSADQSRQRLSGEARRVEDRVLFGLLLALGEFSLDELPSDQKQPTVEQLSRWYSDDPSSAIHGATGWLLRRWGFEKEALRVDQTPVPFDASYKRDWYVIEIKIPAAKSESQPGFFESLFGTNQPAQSVTIHLTMIVIPPGNYEIGSPADQPGHELNETLNRVRLTRPVAILDREVTRGEFEASGLLDADIAQWSPTSEHPMIAPSWYDSVRFCRWLTERAGLTEVDQAYADPNSLDESKYPRDGDVGLPKDWPLNLDAQGFRLPTEAEWEIAAKAGTRTTYGFGSDQSLLERYAWLQTNSELQTHIAKELRPNLRGLFDMHGNTLEWCHDLYNTYPNAGVRSDPIATNAGLGWARVYRGGSWDGVAADCRTANRSSSFPTDHGTNAGLRLALVPFDPAKSVPEPESVDKQGVAELQPDVP